MSNAYFETQTFLPTDLPLPPGEYEQCTFQDLDLSNADLSGYKFADCTFLRCNLSMATVAQTAFREVQFKACKMLGIRFEDCNDLGFSIRLDECALQHASFYGKKLKSTVFQHCQLQDTDFAHCDLSGSTFADCDLAGALFENTNLEKVDFRTAAHYSIDPDQNRIKKARFSADGLAGLLGKYDIVVEG